MGQIRIHSLIWCSTISDLKTPERIQATCKRWEYNLQRPNCPVKIWTCGRVCKTGNMAKSFYWEKKLSVTMHCIEIGVTALPRGFSTRQSQQKFISLLERHTSLSTVWFWARMFLRGSPSFVFTDSSIFRGHHGGTDLWQLNSSVL